MHVLYVCMCETLFYHLVPPWVIPVIVCVAIVFAIGIIVGILLTLFCGICVNGIQQSKFDLLPIDIDAAI